VKVLPYVLGRMIFDLVPLTIFTAIFFACLYSPVPPIPRTPYFCILLAVAWYTSGLGYLVSMVVSPANALLAGIAVGMVLGGVANGVQPPMQTLDQSNPLWLLDWISYSR
jgi:hypothetical protein